MCNAEALFALRSDNSMACKADIWLGHICMPYWVIYLPLADDNVASTGSYSAP